MCRSEGGTRVPLVGGLSSGATDWLTVIAGVVLCGIVPLSQHLGPAQKPHQRFGSSSASGKHTGPFANKVGFSKKRVFPFSISSTGPGLKALRLPSPKNMGSLMGFLGSARA